MLLSLSIGHDLEVFQTSNDNQRPLRPKCNYCGRRNHTEDKCWEKERRERANQTNQEEERAQMGHTFHWPDHYAFTFILFLSSLPDRDPSEWYAD